MYLSKSKITDFKNYSDKYKYTKNYSVTVTRVNVIRYFPPLHFSCSYYFLVVATSTEM